MAPHADHPNREADHQPSDRRFIRAAYTLADDDDWGQAGTLVREVMDDEQCIERGINES